MIPQVSREIIPDILIPKITVRSDKKYDIMLNAKSKNVSVIAFARRKLQYLKMKLVRNPNARPMNRLTMPSKAN